MGGDAGDVDDRALLSFHHGGPELLTREQNTADEVQVEVCRPVFEGDLLKFLVAHDRHLRVVAAGGVDENGRRTQGGFEFFVCFPQAAARHRVGRKELGGAAGLADRGHPGLAAFLVAAEHGHLGAGRSQTLRQAAAEHTRASNDDGDFT